MANCKISLSYMYGTNKKGCIYVILHLCVCACTYTRMYIKFSDFVCS